MGGTAAKVTGPIKANKIPCWKRPADPKIMHGQRLFLTCDPKTNKFTSIQKDAFMNKDGSWKNKWSKQQMATAKRMPEGKAYAKTCKACSQAGCDQDGCCTLAGC